MREEWVGEVNRVVDTWIATKRVSDSKQLMAAPNACTDLERHGTTSDRQGDLETFTLCNRWSSSYTHFWIFIFRSSMPSLHCLDPYPFAIFASSCSSWVPFFLFCLFGVCIPSSLHLPNVVFTPFNFLANGIGMLARLKEDASKP